MEQTFVNGKVFVGTSETYFVSAFKVKDGRISWIGQTEQVDDPQAIDLHQQTVLPGLIDCHTHPKYIADALHGTACTPPNVNSIQEMIAALKASPQYGQGPDVWIEGWGFDETKLAEHRAPTVDDLDQVTTEQPIFIYRSDCHSSVGNSKALALAGIDQNTPDPKGGHIERFPDGRPTGFMREVAASQLLIRAKSAQSYENDVQNMVNSSDHYLENGIVAIGEMMGRLNPYPTLCLYQDAVKQGFKPRASIYYVYDELKPGQALDPVGDDQLRVAGIKIFMDGSISGETADNSLPYPSGKRGVLLTDQAKLKTAIKFAQKHQLQAAIHAMGDAAIQLVLDTTCDLDPWLDDMPSIRIEHASLLSDQMLDQINHVKMRYGLSTQPIFFFAEDESYRNYLTPEQFKLAYRVKSMLKSKALTTLSSDAPCTPWAEPDSPFYSIYAAVTRQAANNDVVNIEEAITVPQAILGYTKWAAEIGGFTHNGTLEVGKSADFVILNKDIFSVSNDELATVNATETWFKGQHVYQKALK
nr:amidohydrolase [Limosilactobacillus mucosae]